MKVFDACIGFQINVKKYSMWLAGQSGNDWKPALAFRFFATSSSYGYSAFWMIQKSLIRAHRTSVRSPFDVTDYFLVQILESSRWFVQQDLVRLKFLQTFHRPFLWIACRRALLRMAHTFHLDFGTEISSKVLSGNTSDKNFCPFLDYDQ